MIAVNGIWLPDDDTHFTRYAEEGSYQQPVFAQALQLTAGRTWAVDIGAHVGFWSRELATAFARVDAFEPVPANLECLRANVPSNVNVHAVALGATVAPLRMRNSNGNTNSGAWEADHVYDDGALVVTTHPLDEFRLWTRGTVDLIKIDVQGMEADVLAGARETLLRARPVVVAEIVCHGQFDYEAEAVLQSLGAKRIGAYKADWIFGWR